PAMSPVEWILIAGVVVIAVGGFLIGSALFTVAHAISAHGATIAQCSWAHYQRLYGPAGYDRYTGDPIWDPERLRREEESWARVDRKREQRERDQRDAPPA